MAHDTLYDIEVRGGDSENVRGLLKLLPENTFEFTRDFRRGLASCGEQFCGQIGIYARKEPLLGDKGVSLIVVNEHLFGDPTSQDYNPVLAVPEGATNVNLVPPRQHPLKKAHPFAGVQFDYEGATFFFGYELSEGAYDTILQSLKGS